MCLKCLLEVQKKFEENGSLYALETWLQAQIDEIKNQPATPYERC